MLVQCPRSQITYSYSYKSAICDRDGYRRMRSMKNKIMSYILSIVCCLLIGCQDEVNVSLTRDATTTPFLVETDSPLLVVTSVHASSRQPLPEENLTLTPAITALADMFILSSQGTADIRVGQTVFIVAPAFSPGWDVKFDKAFLEALSPSDLSQLGDEKGWLFRVTAVGSTTLQFSGVLPTCEPRHPCLAMPSHDFSITLKILP